VTDAKKFDAEPVQTLLGSRAGDRENPRRYLVRGVLSPSGSSCFMNRALSAAVVVLAKIFAYVFSRK
jgi:hypothetical protein